MKRYLLFAGDNYYPLGGWDDFEGDFDTADEALGRLTYLIERKTFWNRVRWGQVIDLELGKQVRTWPADGLPQKATP